MHILFLTHYFPPEVNAPASRTFEHAREWVKHPGVKVTVITNNPNHPKGELYPGHENRWFKREQVEGIEVIRVKTYLAANRGMVRRTFNYLFYMIMAPLAAMSVRKPSVVVGTSPQFFCAVAGYVTALLKTKPFVFELRDIWPDSIVTVGAMKKSLAVHLLEKVELFLYRRAKLIVAVTNAFKANLTSRGIPAGKIEVVKNGADISFFTPKSADPAVAERIGVSGKKVVSYIGTIGMAHAVDKIIEAAEILRSESDIQFLIAGEGAEKESIVALAKGKGLSNVTILAGVSKSEVRELYALSTICLVTLQDKPLFKTVIPSKIFEIMAMGKPILTNVDGETRAIIEEGGAGKFVPPGDAVGLAREVLVLARNGQQRETLAANGRGYVLREYDRRTLASRLLGMLHHAAAEESGVNRIAVLDTPMS